MTEKTFKPLPLGNEDFVSIRQKGKYYVDKTPYLKNVFTEQSSVLLFTRPRRFGKTLLMDMFASFLRLAPDGSDNREFKEKLFDGLEILKDKEFTDKYMGQFPVIFISLKSAYGETFEQAYDALARVVVSLFSDYDFLLNSKNLQKKELENYNKYLDREFLCDINSIGYVKEALKFLSNCLYKHYKKKVILLIDEYDVPLAKASEKGYHDEMVTLISQFFDFMKITPNNNEYEAYPIEKIVLTGCLKVAKNSIFTGVNNITVNTVLSEDYDFDSIIGFTKEETLKLLKDYELEEYATLVKENYDGYRFNEKEMFCPWDVVNFIAESVKKKVSNTKIIPGNYWINSTSSNALLSYVGYLTDKATDKMQALMDGLSIETYINDSMNYDTLSKHEEIDFFSLLLHTGYLTSDGYRVVDADTQKPKAIYSLRIPNLEIRECFETNILQHFKESSTQGENKAMLIANALFEGDCETASDKIYDLLLNYVSVRDFATKAKPENYYHGFLSGVFACCGDYINNFKSNTETGNGYADITFLDRRGSKLVIIELKASKNIESVIIDAKNAIKQIDDKEYAKSYITHPFVNKIYSYGISFYKKDCYIELKKIK
ncbi:AAA family ATPase [Succinivibrio faecicola]|uniref:AAA family ATPase n=1 Tax=Succinivibrio faecicola TaxID=2820300 RepID=A0ABS7DI58_9GAMM|nr:AAA family ATPase [Succinivibrio faecicola]MBW7570979.1 AAA family ATPase [Succinivibrio faecicola]